MFDDDKGRSLKWKGASGSGSEPLSKDKKYTLEAADLEKQYDVRKDLRFTIEVNLYNYIG